MLRLAVCDPVGILTQDLQNRNLTFYTTELRSQCGCKCSDFSRFEKRNKENLLLKKSVFLIKMYEFLYLSSASTHENQDIINQRCQRSQSGYHISVSCRFQSIFGRFVGFIIGNAGIVESGQRTLTGIDFYR